MQYTPSYFDDYYGDSYESTYQYGFPLERILSREWKASYKDLPQSFADIGCGCGQTLLEARRLLPNASLIYGVESQKIPSERVVSKDIVFGDFMDLYQQLPAVDLLYVACSMYIPWQHQSEFIAASISLARKAVVFANLYIEDGKAIPSDSLRQIIYKNRSGFRDAMKSFRLTFAGSKDIDFYLV